MLDEVENVLLGDTAAGAGTADFGQIDVVLAGKFADERRRADIGFVVFLLDGWRGLRWSGLRRCEDGSVPGSLRCWGGGAGALRFLQVKQELKRRCLPR